MAHLQQQQQCCKNSICTAPTVHSHVGLSRRTMLWSTTAGVTAWVTLNQAAQARQEPLNKEVDAAESPYIQELLRRSREKKEQRDKERLQDYYKRNFKDYFEFEGGSIRAGKARGIQPDTQQAILQWLELNKD